MHELSGEITVSKILWWSNQKTDKSQIIQDKETPSKTAQKAPKSAPSAPQQLYEEKEINGDFTRFDKILSKIKNELKINSFLELADYFEKLYTDIMTQNDIAKKHIIFMDSVSKIQENCK